MKTIECGSCDYGISTKGDFIGSEVSTVSQVCDCSCEEKESGITMVTLDSGTRISYPAHGITGDVEKGDEARIIVERDPDTNKDFHEVGLSRDGKWYKTVMFGIRPGNVG